MKENDLKEKLCLCMDTSTKVASVAVAKSSNDENIEILYSVFLNDGLTHSEKLVPLIDGSLSACGLKTSDIDLFSCISGPGSYTGLRIGISTANALAQSVQKDVIGVTSLETLAYAFKYFDGLIIPMIDARRDDVFTAVFEGDEFQRISDELPLSVDEVLENIKDSGKNIFFVGDGAKKAKDRAEMMFGNRAKFADGISNYVNASIGAELSLQKYFSSDYKNEKVVMPNYIKATSAKTQAERDMQAKK